LPDALMIDADDPVMREAAAAAQQRL